MGAHMRGPIANPRTNSEIPRVTTSSLTLKVATICSTPPLYADETKATARVAYES